MFKVVYKLSSEMVFFPPQGPGEKRKDGQLDRNQRGLNSVDLQERIKEVETRIAEACRKSGRKRDEINVVAVTKYVSVRRAEEALDLGCRHLGENRWPDAKEKWERMNDRAVWHFIGQLQSKKVRHVIDKFRYFHSLDRLSLAGEMEKRAAAAGVTAQCFIQVNVSGEQTKAGLSPDEVPEFAERLNEFEHLRIIGLMTMAPYEPDPEKTRPVFSQLRELRDRLNDEGRYRQPLPHLSMGMSNDFEVALEEGATWLRLGSVLMGQE